MASSGRYIAHVHHFEPRQGGAFRVSLTYDIDTGRGKTSTATDTYRGQFVRLLPDSQVVEVIEFETTNPALVGQMTMTTTLRADANGTEVEIAHDGIPSGVAPADNELGTRMALAKLATLVESR